MRGIRVWGTIITGMLSVLVAPSGHPRLTLAWAQEEASDLDRAKQLNLQGVELYEQGQYEKAVNKFRESLHLWEETLGLNHPDVAVTLDNLAELYLRQGKYGQAEPLFQRALQIREKALGSDHPDVATSLNGLALLHTDQGNYVQAELIYRQSLQITEKALGSDHPDVAASLSGLALLYTYQGNFAQAEPLYRQALQISEKALGPNHPDVAISLSGLATLYYNQENYAQAEPLYQRALQIEEKFLGPDHPSVAISLNNLALLYYRQGNYAQAEPLYQRALQISEKALGPDHSIVVVTLDNLAELYRAQEKYDQIDALSQHRLSGKQLFSLALNDLQATAHHVLQGNYAQAESLYKSTLQTREKALGPNHPDVAVSLDRLANLYDDQGKYSEAEPLYQRALQIREKALGPDHPDLAASLSGLAGFYLELGNYAQAEPLYQRALQIREKALGLDQSDETKSLVIANVLSALALLYYHQGNYLQAESLYQRALQIWEETLDLDTPAMATTLDNLALLYTVQADYSEAEPLYQRALQVREKFLGPDHPSVAYSLNNLGTLYLYQGKYDEAKSLSQRSLKIWEKALGSNHPNVAISLNNLALLYRVQGNYAEAEPLFQQSLSIYDQAQGPVHPSIVPSLHNLATFHLMTGSPEKALSPLSRVTDIEETQLNLNLFSLSSHRQEFYVETFRFSTDTALSYSIQLADTDPAAAGLALTTLLRRKGRLLDLSANTFSSLRQQSTPAVQTLLDQLRSLQAQLAQLYYDPLSSSSPHFQSHLEQLTSQIRELEEQLRTESPAFRRETQPVSLANVQNQLPANTALLEFVRYSPFNLEELEQGRFEWGDPRYAVAILHPQGAPIWLDLGDADQIDQLITRWRLSLQDKKSSLQQVHEQARALNDIVMKPLRDHLGNTRNLLIAPDGQLNLIPFEVLMDESERYLVETHTLTYLTSGRDLLRWELSPLPQEAPLIVANPDFDTSNTSPQLTASYSQRSVDLDDLRFGPLPGTEREAEALSSLFENAQIWRGEVATEEAVKQIQAPEILHLATHGFFLESLDTSTSTPGFQEMGEPTLLSQTASPENRLLRSGLALAGFNQRRSGSEDGVLTALEVTGLNLNGTELVVLSACETGVGEVTSGEGVYGLRRSLVLAGSRRQVMSLWKVDDQETVELMVGYYQKLKEGRGSSEALREVQIEMITQHPYYWASFIASGDWRPFLDSK